MVGWQRRSPTCASRAQGGRRVRAKDDETVRPRARESAGVVAPRNHVRAWSERGARADPHAFADAPRRAHARAINGFPEFVPSFVLAGEPSSVAGKRGSEVSHAARSRKRRVVAPVPQKDDNRTWQHDVRPELARLFVRRFDRERLEQHAIRFPEFLLPREDGRLAHERFDVVRRDRDRAIVGVDCY